MLIHYLNNYLMEKVKNLVASKLCKLSSFLFHACKEFDKVAKHIKENKIKMSVRNVALKTKQFQNELNSQLQMLGVNCIIGRVNNNEEIKSNHVINKPISDKKIIELCCNSEVFFSKAYKSILNEYFPYKPLRDMLRYQLTGIHHAFRQLKLLNSVMTPQAGSTAIY
jgi:hypothetical protein